MGVMEFWCKKMMEPCGLPPLPVDAQLWVCQLFLRTVMMISMFLFRNRFCKSLSKAYEHKTYQRCRCWAAQHEPGIWDRWETLGGAGVPFLHRNFTFYFKAAASTRWTEKVHRQALCLHIFCTCSPLIPPLHVHHTHAHTHMHVHPALSKRYGILDSCEISGEYGQSAGKTTYLQFFRISSPKLNVLICWYQNLFQKKKKNL